MGTNRAKKAAGWSFWFGGQCWDRAAPTPASEASPSSTNSSVGSRSRRMETVVGRSLSSLKAKDGCVKSFFKGSEV